MREPTPELNAAVIEAEMDWLEAVLAERLDRHAAGLRGGNLASLASAPLLAEGGSPYADLLRRHGLDADERLVLALAYAPHVRPEALDGLLIPNQVLQRRFSEFGGHAPASGGLLPTGETAMFLLGGGEVARRLRLQRLFGPDHVFQAAGLLVLEDPGAAAAPLAGVLRPSPECLERLTTGRAHAPGYGRDFPAQRLVTALDWRDLVVDDATRAELDDIGRWLRHRYALMEGWDLARRLKPGYRALFHGPSGTGKTLAASLIGKLSGLPVYRVDLSRVVSKYIGDTEKNLARLFDYAQHQDWILFFDEADSLFGRRVETANANDRAANQQVSYLLQRIEDFPGLVVLATNLKANLDPAFSRRFQSMLLFRTPDEAQRLQLWRDNFADKPYPLAPDVDLPAIAKSFEMSGGAIVNVLRFACLRAMDRKPHVITRADLLQGARRELHKEGKFIV